MYSMCPVFGGIRRYLRNVSVGGDHQPALEFNQDGRLKATELTIVNLRPGQGTAANSPVWEQVSLTHKSSFIYCTI
jgi:hypothetical protein